MILSARGFWLLTQFRGGHVVLSFSNLQVQHVSCYNASKPCRSVASSPAVRPMNTSRERRAASSAGGICSGGTRSSSTCEPAR